MSSDRRISRRTAARPLAAPALLLAAGILALACGHKKPPQPPPSKVPQRVTLEAHQRGHEAIVTFPYPTTTISGTGLDGLGKVEVWQLAQEVPEFAVEMLAEEAAGRAEAQKLLDDLGLSLYETPEGVPGMPGAPGTPPEGTSLDGATAMTPGMEGNVAPPAVGTVDEMAPEETVPPPSEVIAPEDAGSAEAGEAADGTGNAAGDDEGEGETPPEAESELSPEEQLQVRIDTARNLLRSPPTQPSTFIQATPKDFRSDSELVLELEDADIDAAVIGDRIVLRLPVPPRPDEGPEIGYIYGVKIFSLQRKASEFSNLVSLLPVETPVAPQAVIVEAQGDGVHVDWTAEEDPKEGFRVYRRVAQTRTYGEAVGTVAATQRSYIDRQAVYGARYIYGVTAVADTSPLVESDISSEHEIDYQDRFGPRTPGGLVAFPEAGRVRLLWTTVTDPDLAGYEVLRRAADETEARVVSAGLVTAGQYLDQNVPSGEWFYSVRAVDETGNRSDDSAETPARVP
jgi:hypothetical protein